MLDHNEHLTILIRQQNLIGIVELFKKIDRTTLIEILLKNGFSLNDVSTKKVIIEYVQLDLLRACRMQKTPREEKEEKGETAF
ncbi:MAG: hypothetical protein OEZ58_00050 [Gammaproteobacteria bacterium]|nr:hypothetical protein [Gammaproteobacteria bacterium]